MRLSYHPAVQRDVNHIIDHYREVSGEALVQRFYNVLMAELNKVAGHPERYPFYLGQVPFRRAKLDRFPHIIVFRVLADRVRIQVIKHEKRHPGYGMKRR